MPQQRRKLPFSGKKKKEQIMQKRHLKGTSKFYKSGEEHSQDDGETTEDNEITQHKLMEQPMSRAGSSAMGTTRNKNLNRYNLQFFQESKKELEQLRQDGFKPLSPVTPDMREINSSYFDGHDFPVRPEWTYNTTKESLNCNEHRYFREYVDKLQAKYTEQHKALSLFELNLETWRQLWRVLEFSDILLIIVDIRYATLMFPPDLYKYIVNVLKKHAILVLNKIDLVAPPVVVAWRHYFQETYPGLPIVIFASYSGKTMKACGRGGYKRSIEGVFNIYQQCEKLMESTIDLKNWELKILEDMQAADLYINDEPETEVISKESAGNAADETPRLNEQQHSLLPDGVLTIGCLGFPNVGKSSLINALKGRKVVSVSRTPGHTKHFQTIFLTKEVRVCDCPGLVFPSNTPKHLQVLMGSYPISQLQVPYRSLKFLAEHINMPKLLKLQLPDDFDEWSAVALADAWALKKGFLTAKAARPDRYRAANNLLRMCLAGQQGLVLQFYPPKFDEKKDIWETHSEIEQIKNYQQAPNDFKDCNDDTSSVYSESAESEETSNSNDETNADEEDDEYKQGAAKPRNTFAVLDAE